MSTIPPVRYHHVEVNGAEAGAPARPVRVFVRQAGPPGAPTIVLLHGYPSSSHMFRELIPRLADRFRVIAPDLVGFGHSDAPPASEFRYTFAHLTLVTERVLAALEATDYVLYLHDYGGPIGLRLAERNPARVRGLVVQNANAYMAGVSDTVAGVFLPLWKERTAATEAPAQQFMTAPMTQMQYTAGARDAAGLDPTAWVLDQALLDRPVSAEIQMSLFVDYQDNVARYDGWHAYFRAHQPRTLILWGRGDPLFIPPGAEAFRTDLPEVTIEYLEGGHFALEENADRVAARIQEHFAPAAGPADPVQSFYARLGAGDLDGALALVTDDVRWNDPEGFPAGGKLRGRAEVKQKVFGKLLSEWKPFGVHVDRIIYGQSTDGATALALGRYSGVFAATGKPIDLAFAHLWTVEGGRLAAFETFTDTATMRQAMQP